MPDITAGICVSGVSTELTAVQQLGRGTRKVGDKITLFFNLYCEGTVEENWVRTKTQQLGNVY